MHAGKLVFAQLTEPLPLSTFRRCVALYAGDYKIKSFTCLEQFLCLAFAQLTYREGLRDIEACLRAQRDKIYRKMPAQNKYDGITNVNVNFVRRRARELAHDQHKFLVAYYAAKGVVQRAKGRRD